MIETPQSPFTKLNALLDGLAPGMTPISMSIGEPQHPPPNFVGPLIAENAAQFGRYPPIHGPEVLRRSIAAWLSRRYGLGGAIDPERHILPLVGTREGLFLSVFILDKLKASADRPAILIPNPFYQCYAAAALAAGAEPVYVDATRENGFLPDLERLPPALLTRTAAVFLCSPSNPEGAAANADYWERLFAFADEHDFTVLADECYAEIYDRLPPIGALSIRKPRAFSRLLAFHSLSKRSSLPGLRSGFVAGDPKLIARFREFRNVVGPTMPLPLAVASAAVWDDEAHVEENRALYRAKFELAQSILGNRFGFYCPDGGFFLWLEVGDGDKAARTLWSQAGVRALPGSTLAKDTGQGNPAKSFIRVALVNDFATTDEALRRIARTL
jgi:aspartate/methionine/tyrosine aminotransferase